MEAAAKIHSRDCRKELETLGLQLKNLEITSSLQRLDSSHRGDALHKAATQSAWTEQARTRLDDTPNAKQDVPVLEKKVRMRQNILVGQFAASTTHRAAVPAK